MSAMDTLRRALAGWEPADLDWLAGEITAGNISPPQPCTGCGEPTGNIDETYGPLCDDCDQARAEAASEDDPAGGDDGYDSDNEDQP